MVRDETEKHETLTMSQYFMEEDEIYPLVGYQGAPEFAMFERERFNVTNDEEIPSVSVSSNLGPHDLAPLPSEFTLVY